MLRSLLDRLSPEISGQTCMDHVETIVRHHRIQASPGYRAAAGECLARFRQAGLEASITTYPATGRNWAWASLTPQEWDCRSAELWLLDDQGRTVRRLAWYEELNLSVIQRSCSTPDGGITAEVAVVEKAEEAQSWAGRDLAGKLVLVGNGDIHRMLAHARRAGAAGLLTDRMTYSPPVRPEGDLADARQYTSFWWSEGEEKAWGFVLTPRQGQELRAALARGPVRLHARVDAAFYDGTIENVEAVIPGTGGGQEVLVVSHLCHPKPSACDNATGPATVMEAARVLQKLIAEGTLPRPARTIRFLLPPEMTGTYAHLAALPAGGTERIACALNVDMVGQKQEVTGSVLLAEYPPMACPSFAGDLLALVQAEVARETASLSGTGTRYALFRHAVTNFSGGSDHYILADPSVGVPCPMIIQWPDRFYHTSWDTADKADPAMMRRVALMTAMYAYFAASAGAAEARWLASEMTALFPAQLHGAMAGAADPEATAGFRVERKLADLQSLERLTGDPALLGSALDLYARQVHLAAELELQRLAVAAAGNCTAADAQEGPAGTVQGWLSAADTTAVRPVRRQPGPISLRHQLDRLPEAEAESWRAFTAAHAGAGRLADYLCYWSDGQRTLAEVCRLAALETGLRNDAWALGYFQLLNRLGLAEL